MAKPNQPHPLSQTPLSPSISSMSLTLFTLLVLGAANAVSISANSGAKETQIGSIGERLELSNLIIRGNKTIKSENQTFELGFFSTNGESNWYLGICYTSIPTPTYVWVANRENPAKNLALSSFQITDTGQLAVKEAENSVWESSNAEKAARFSLLESGNLVLLSSEGSVVWQSFDYPTDTWLPGMNLTAGRSLTSWRSLFDPSPGFYSLRLNPRGFNEFQLVYNQTEVYWSTGNWTGSAFANVPQMMISYIYKFHFADPYLSTASFWFNVRALDGGNPPLTRFRLDVNGQLMQFTWTAQVENWNMFWSQPEDKCKVYGLCGDLGFCISTSLKPCLCLNGFSPVDDRGWNSGDYSGGCRRQSSDSCSDRDGFEEVGVVGFEGGSTVSFPGNRRFCEKSCLSNCSCIGLFHNGKTNLCKNLFGSLLNLRNMTSYSLDMNGEVLYVRAPMEGISKKNVSKTMVLVGSIVGSIAVLGFTLITLLILRKRREMRKGKDDDAEFPVLNLKVFTYKELNAATKGFSEKLGHGGFGAVFKGDLVDSTLIAVKRLERPGSGEKEFRAEVCTIGNIQHVNLVRLRGFCSENLHRMLVYDYMPNGPLSAYLCRDGPNLCWEVRFRVAVGTARGITYLHEGCRDCIIHCDIKPENILLDRDYTAKVSDFGLAKLVGRDFSRVLATMRGTWGYVAPEWISGMAITSKADVYSYGMTLLELIGGRRNVEAAPPADNANVNGEENKGEKWFFPPWAARKIIEDNIAAIVDSRLGVAYNIEEAERLAMVAIWCIQDEEEMRPAMGMVVKMLEGVVEVGVPPPPKLIQALVAGDSYRGVRLESGASGGCSDYNVGLSSAGSRSSAGNISSPLNANLDS